MTTTSVTFNACVASSTFVHMDAGTSPEWTITCPYCAGEVNVHPTGVGTLRIARHLPAVNLNGYLGVHTPGCYAQEDPDSCACPGSELLEPTL